MTATLQPVACAKCQGSGFDTGMDVSAIKSGRLLPMCDGCRGTGLLDLVNAVQPFRAAWVVGNKYLVRMTVERRKGGLVELDIEWSPRMPPDKGRGKLRPSERQEYEQCRNEALRMHMQQMGGGEWSVIGAGERH